MVAHMHADEVPIAVPKSCKKCMSPHSKKLFLITITMAFFSGSRGKFLGSLLPVAS